MTEQELLDMFIDERIGMLLLTLNQQPETKKAKEEQERILQAKDFIEQLPPEEKELMQDYIMGSMEKDTIKERYLYQQGILDGVKILKFLHHL